jgi:hypothetical protein
MRVGVLTSCCVALLFGGCAKRQSGLRLVYVAPPPAASAPSAPDSGTWVIEEPVPPEPEVAKPTSEVAPPAPPPRAQKPRRPTAAEPSSTEPTPAPTEPSSDGPSVGPPPLVPADGAGGADLRQKIETTQRSLSQRVTDFEHGPLSDTERRTLDQAKAFLEQSRRALNDGDLRRADNLAYKADLLIAAFEQRH